MRKYQIETFRREVPDGGYVVSVIRDFPLAAMGLVDYLGRDKWPAESWSWHGDAMLTLITTNDRRTFIAGEALSARVVAAGPAPTDVTWSVTVKSYGANAKPIWESSTSHVAVKLPPYAIPTRLSIVATLSHLGKPIATNEWPVWAIPAARSIPQGIIVARRLDEALLARLEAGAKVLLLPNNGPGSPPLQSHWFLRGGPVVFPHAALAGVPREMLVETQHFDMAGDVIPKVSYATDVDPILMLWDNHDIREVRTHAGVYTTRIGHGRLLVSTLRHDGDTNAVGKWLLGEFAHYLSEGPPPRTALTSNMVAGIRRKLTEQKLDLGGKQVWKFQPDPKDEGLAKGWHKPETKDADWSDIQIDRHWEGQGHPTLDGWAWYRLTITIPKAFSGKDVYLKFTGVDDYYEAYVNGVKAGSGGDIPTKKTAFDEVKSHKVTELIKPGETATIAVRVYDWYGAGGIFRPVTLTTAPDDSNGSAFIR